MLLFRTIKENELSQWFSLCKQNFGGIPERFFEAPFWEEGGNLNNIIVAVKEGRIIGGLRLVYRSAKLCGNEYMLGGITDLNIIENADYFVLVEMLRYAFQFLDNKKVDYILGYTTIASPLFYNRLNTYELNQNYIIYEIRNSIKSSEYQIGEFEENNLCDLVKFIIYVNQEKSLTLFEVKHTGIM